MTLRMKTAWSLLGFVLVGCASSQEAPHEMDETAAALTRGHAVPYREVNRVYDGLDRADRTSCAATFRFLDGNWMDCQVDVDARYSGSLRQITSARLPIRSFSFPTDMPDVSLFVRVEQDTGSRTLPNTALYVTAYYTRAGVIEIQTLPTTRYAYAGFATVVDSALKSLAEDPTYGGSVFALSGSANEHPLATDHPVGDIYVGKRTEALGVDACARAYSDEIVDGWPDVDHWASDCTVSVAESRLLLPLDEDQWSDRLRAIPRMGTTVVKVTDPSAPAGTVPTVTLSYGDGSYTAAFTLVDTSTGLARDASIPWTQARAWMVQAITHVPQVTWSVLFKAADLSALAPQEAVVGRLVRRSGKLDIE